MRVSTRIWGAGRIFLLVGGLVATFGVFFVASLRVAVRAREVVVPDLRGRSISDASAALGHEGLTFKVEPQRRPDPKVPADHVLSQDPLPGTVLRRQRSVRVYVSDGVHQAQLPVVVGENERSAQLHLAQAEITVTSVTDIRTDAYPAGTVIGQDPPGRGFGPTVSLLVNRGKPAVTYVMPDLIGTIGTRAAEVLRRQGFVVSFSGDSLYPGVPPGIVIHQTPQAGFQIAASDVISIEVSR
jgi:beta-lactam-binding protein with PASTA domain